MMHILVVAEAGGGDVDRAIAVLTLVSLIVGFGTLIFRRGGVDGARVQRLKAIEERLAKFKSPESIDAELRVLRGGLADLKSAVTALAKVDARQAQAHMDTRVELAAFRSQLKAIDDRLDRCGGSECGS